jgi:hypothetical protein
LNRWSMFIFEAWRRRVAKQHGNQVMIAVEMAIEAPSPAWRLREFLLNDGRDAVLFQCQRRRPSWPVFEALRQLSASRWQASRRRLRLTPSAVYS